MANVRLENVNKYYNDKHIVFDMNLEIYDKEFLVIVGPSGCGKSTTIRMIAGLEDITSGKIYINDKMCNFIQPKDREIAMVFQNYALYPNMNVYDNIAFGLKSTKKDKKEIDEIVHKVAKTLHIEEYLARKPKALSGGQRQRVALGRAIARSPKVFLMDEPLSNLDAKLRAQMRTEIVKIHREIGGTTIYVTHDQTEAMTMANRIVVMNQGVIQQCATPDEIYNHPTNLFVATFMGAPNMNIYNATIKGNQLIVENKTIDLNEKQIESLKEYNNSEIIIGVRPEDIIIDENGMFESKVTLCELIGSESNVYFDFQGKTSAVVVPGNNSYKLNEKIKYSFNLDKIHLFDKDSKITLY